MSLALYRKYRPTTFSELIGQEHVTEPLSQALRSGRLNHAYLFSGPRGCGKTSSARILARSLNCAQGPTPEPCGECESCRALSNDGPGSIDVIEIDAASHGGVDDARDLRERAFYTPVAGRYKIYVIDEAHMVSSAGFNALLKLVEEPPDYVKFVFATTEPEKVLPTIRSRTHHYPFRLIPPSVLRPYLEQLCGAERVSVEPAVFPLVMRAGGGSVRDTLSVLDQLIAGAGQEGVTYARAAALLGVTDAALIDELCDALAAGDGAGMFATVDRVAEAGHDARRFAADLLERLRDLIILQQVPEAAAKGLLDVPADQLERMSVHASQLGLATLSRCADIVHDGLVEMRGTASPRLLLELICARMLLPGADAAGGGLLQRLERLERRLGATGDPPTSPPASGGPVGARPASAPSPAPPAPPANSPVDPAPAGADPAGPPPADPGSTTAPPATAAPATAVPSTAVPSTAAPATGPPVDPPPAAAQPAPGPPVQPAPGPPAPPAAGAGPPQPGIVDAAAIRRVWQEIVNTIRSKRTAAVAREASVREVEGDTIVLHFQHAVHASMLSSGPEPLLEAVQAVLGGRWLVRCEIQEDSRPGVGGTSGPPADAVPVTSAAGPPSPGGEEPDWPELTRPGGEPPPAPSASGGPPGAPGHDPQAGRTAPAGHTPSAGHTPPSDTTSPPGPVPPAPAVAPPALRAGTATGVSAAAPPRPRAAAVAAAGAVAGSADDGVDELSDAPADPRAAGERALRLLQQTLGAERITGATP